MLPSAVRFALALGLGLLLAACGSGRGSHPRDAGRAAPVVQRGRLIILGFDGVDPRWLERFVREGKMPNAKRLIEANRGENYRPLTSTNPPQSPVAWSTFATGTNPGQHGIYDFISRRFVENAAGDASPVMPFPGTTLVEVPAAGPPIATTHRSGIPFWKTLADDGVPTVAINVPYSFPPDPMREGGRILSGLGTPDLRMSNSNFTVARSSAVAERNLSGGYEVPLTVSGERATFELSGPPVPGESREHVKATIELRVNAQGVALKSGDEFIPLTRDRLSRFVEISFTRGQITHKGIARFMLVGPDGGTNVFVTPVSIDPNEPFLPVSYPNEFAGRVAGDLARDYKTVGWDHDTSSLDREVVDDASFLAEMDDIERDRREMLMDAIARDDFKMLIWVSTATDRVAHMFYRVIDPQHPRHDAALAARIGDPIEREYKRMDETLGLVMARLRPDDTLLVLSDHGFHNYRRGVHLNSWLQQNGFQKLKEGVTVGASLDDVDWGLTQAYAVGTGQIYLNLRGREPRGTVSLADAPEVIRRIREGLVALRDTERENAQPISNAYEGRTVYTGRRASDAPDLQVAFAENYRNSWESMLGGSPAGIFADNMHKWSGDHSSSDVADTPGILISNRPLARSPAIVGISTTALRFFGRPVPRHYEGESVLREGASR